VDKLRMDEPALHIGNIIHFMKNPYSFIYQHSALYCG
jgi:hypothetical protein